MEETKESSVSWAESVASGVEFQQYNKGDTLPFGYFHPQSEGQIFWICNYNKDNKIISVFANNNYPKNDPQHQIVQELKDLNEAIFFRDALVKDDWQELKQPKKTFIANGVKVEMTKKVKDHLSKIAKRELKKNSAIAEEVKAINKETAMKSKKNKIDF